MDIRELTFISAIAAISIVLKLLFSQIPNLEVVTGLFIAFAILLRRETFILYFCIFIILDFILIMNFNIFYSFIYFCCWLCLYFIVSLLKRIKFSNSLIAVIVGFLSTFIFSSIWMFVFFIPTKEAYIAAMLFDLSSLHPFFTVIITLALIKYLPQFPQFYRYVEKK